MTYDQWKDQTDYWDPPSQTDGLPSDDQLLDQAVAEARTTPDETHDAILSMIGLVQSICARADCPEAIKTAMLRDRRYLDARAVGIAYL